MARGCLGCCDVRHDGRIGRVPSREAVGLSGLPRLEDGFLEAGADGFLTENGLCAEAVQEALELR